MGYLVVLLILAFFIYFVVKKIKERKLKKNSIEEFGEIKMRLQKKNQILIKTKSGEISLNVTPEEFMSLGVGLVGLFRYNKESHQLIKFQPYKKA